MENGSKSFTMKEYPALLAILQEAVSDNATVVAIVTLGYWNSSVKVRKRRPAEGVTCYFVEGQMKVHCFGLDAVR